MGSEPDAEVYFISNNESRSDAGFLTTTQNSEATWTETVLEPILDVDQLQLH